MGWTTRKAKGDHAEERRKKEMGDHDTIRKIKNRPIANTKGETAYHAGEHSSPTLSPSQYLTIRSLPTVQKQCDPFSNATCMTESSCANIER